jgi:hypothetical protein
MDLEKYSIGIGDRFGFQCAAQLRALQKAAEMGPRMAELRRECRSTIEENVTMNIYERHIRPLFLGLESNE